MEKARGKAAGLKSATERETIETVDDVEGVGGRDFGDQDEEAEMDELEEVPGTMTGISFRRITLGNASWVGRMSEFSELQVLAHAAYKHFVPKLTLPAPKSVAWKKTRRHSGKIEIMMTSDPKVSEGTWFVLDDSKARGCWVWQDTGNWQTKLEDGYILFYSNTKPQVRRYHYHLLLEYPPQASSPYRRLPVSLWLIHYERPTDYCSLVPITKSPFYEAVMKDHELQNWAVEDIPVMVPPQIAQEEAKETNKERVRVNERKKKRRASNGEVLNEIEGATRQNQGGDAKNIFANEVQMPISTPTRPVTRPENGVIQRHLVNDPTLVAPQPRLQNFIQERDGSSNISPNLQMDGGGDDSVDVDVELVKLMQGDAINTPMPVQVVEPTRSSLHSRPSFPHRSSPSPRDPPQDLASRPDIHPPIPVTNVRPPPPPHPHIHENRLEPIHHHPENRRHQYLPYVPSFKRKSSFEGNIEMRRRRKFMEPDTQHYILSEDDVPLNSMPHFFSSVPYPQNSMWGRVSGPQYDFGKTQRSRSFEDDPLRDEDAVELEYYHFACHQLLDGKIEDIEYDVPDFVHRTPQEDVHTMLMFSREENEKFRYWKERTRAMGYERNDMSTRIGRRW